VTFGIITKDTTTTTTAAAAAAADTTDDNNSAVRVAEAKRSSLYTLKLDHLQGGPNKTGPLISTACKL